MGPNGPVRVVGDLPEVAVGIGEIAVVTTPVRSQRGARDPPARRHRQREELVHVGRTVEVDGESSPAIAGVAAGLGRDACIFREVVVTPDGEDAAVGVKEADLARNRSFRQRPPDRLIEGRAAHDVAHTKSRKAQTSGQRHINHCP